MLDNIKALLGVLFFLLLSTGVWGVEDDEFGVESLNPKLRALKAKIERFAKTDSIVLIRGASGTGKEVLATQIHALSLRSQKPLLTVNVAAISEQLLESELFGHRKGAFTNADQNRVGIFEEADGGTLFLDELGEMSPGMQTKLLRVIENGEFYPVGSSQLKKTNVRVIAATNADLFQSIQSGKFREDLYYRLSVIELVLPSLKERPEDIVPLASYFLALANTEYGVDKRFSETTRHWLLEQSWPGNIRQLSNMVKRATLLSEGDIEPEDFGRLIQTETKTSSSSPSGLASSFMFPNEIEDVVSLGRLDAAYCAHVLALHGGNEAATAKVLGITKPKLKKMIEASKAP